MDAHWSPDEDAQLLEMLRLKYHRAIMAKVLGRTEMAVRWRIGMLKALHGSDAPFNRPIFRRTTSIRVGRDAKTITTDERGGQQPH